MVRSASRDAGARPLALGFAAALIASSPALPSGSSAQVHVDPDGPAGKEYAIPLDRARAENGGGDHSAAVPGTPQEAPPFGEGVTPSSGTSPGRAEGTGAGSPLPSEGAESADGNSSKAILAGIVAAVLVLGAGAGFALSGLTGPRAT